MSSFFMLSAFVVVSQEDKISENVKEFHKIEIDSLYREDQFYIGLTYNTFSQQPPGLSQQKFSVGLNGGFQRDMPINKSRTLAIASGLGLAINNYHQNLRIAQDAGVNSYEIINSQTAYDKNKFFQFLAEAPVEFRWRTSTYESHKFWRIYGGVKFSYLLSDRSVYQDSAGKTIIRGNKDFNKFLYGAYFSAGYNSVNIYAYYGLTPVFKSAKIGAEKIAMNALNVGLEFYIL